MRLKSFLTKRPTPRSSESGDALLADEMMEEAANTPLLLVDEAQAIDKPELTLHAEEKFDHLAEEQRRLFDAAGTRAAEEAEAEAAGVSPAADAQEQRVQQAQKLLLPPVAFLEQAAPVLYPHVSRGPAEKPRYYLTIVGLLGGDVAGIAGAAIALGEVVWLAALQALSVAVAMIVIGTLAAELKFSRLQRQRQKHPQDLLPEEKPFAFMFSGADAGEVIVRFVVMGGLLSVLLVGVGILSLRSATDGTLPGLVFGLLSTAIALGSWANSYSYADDVADKLDSYDKKAKKALKRQEKEANGGPLAESERQASRAESIRQEYAAQGLAAVEHVHAAKHKALEVNPGVAGHGVASNGVSHNGNGSKRSPRK